MSFNNAVVWIDHTKAHVIHFDKDAAESESLKTHSTHPHPHVKHGDSHATDDDNTRFFSDIATALKETQQILIVGPGGEKTAFMKYLTTVAPLIADNVKATEAVDHPSDGQLLSFARRHFVASGGLQ